MKKCLYTAIAAMMVISLAACGGEKKDDAKTKETTAASAAVEGIGVDGDGSIAGPVDISGMVDFQATVQKVDGLKLTVEYADGTSLTVDTSDAFINPAWQLMPGDEVDIFYEGDTEVPADGTKVAEVVMSVPYELCSEDYASEPQVYGEIVKLDENSITVREEEGINSDNGPKDGEEYTFKIPSYATTIGELKTGDYAQVLYIGELGSDSVATYRICSDDMMEDPASDVYEIKGTLDKVESGVVYLNTDEGDVFCFTVDGDEALAKLADDSTGKKVKISYTDSIRMRVSTCNGITVIE